MASIVVRPAELGDVQHLVALMQVFYADAGFALAPDAAAQTFAALLQEPQLGQAWLMTCDGEPAGFIVLTVSFSMEYGGLRGYVDDFFVLRQFRRRGLGAAGLRTLRRACAERGVRALLVEVGPENEPALNAYRKSGFMETGHALLKLELEPQMHL